MTGCGRTPQPIRLQLSSNFKNGTRCPRPDCDAFFERQEAFVSTDSQTKTNIGEGVKIGPGTVLTSRRSLGPGTKVGLIGLGLMGRPMGHNLLKAGYSLTVWNRTASRADSLVAAGAKLAKSPQEVAAASDFLLTMVS